MCLVDGGAAAERESLLEVIAQCTCDIVNVASLHVHTRDVEDTFELVNGRCGGAIHRLDGGIQKLIRFSMEIQITFYFTFRLGMALGQGGGCRTPQNLQFSHITARKAGRSTGKCTHDSESAGVKNVVVLRSSLVHDTVAAFSVRRGVNTETS